MSSILSTELVKKFLKKSKNTGNRWEIFKSGRQTVRAQN